MPDLDYLFDTVVADVSAGTHAPGAPTAMRQAHRRRTTIASAAAFAVVSLAVGGGLVAGTLGDSDRPSPIGELTTPSPESPTVQEGPEASPGSDEYFAAELRKTLAQVPDWTITDMDPTILEPCGGDWSSDAVGGSGGSIGIGTLGEPPSVWHGAVGFPSAAQASDAVTALVENLESCTAVTWRTQAIAQTGAVLASSAHGVIWIHHKGANVTTLEGPTTDGPPPLGVQVEVADLIWSTTTG